MTTTDERERDRIDRRARVLMAQDPALDYVEAASRAHAEVSGPRPRSGLEARIERLADGVDELIADRRGISVTELADLRERANRGEVHTGRLALFEEASKLQRKRPGLEFVDALVEIEHRGLWAHADPGVGGSVQVTAYGMY